MVAEGGCVIDVIPEHLRTMFEDEPEAPQPLPGGMRPWCDVCGVMVQPRTPCKNANCPHRPLGGGTTCGAGWPD